MKPNEPKTRADKPIVAADSLTDRSQFPVMLWVIQATDIKPKAANGTSQNRFLFMCASADKTYPLLSSAEA